MKTKYIIAASSAAVIAGSVFYYLSRRSKKKKTAVKFIPHVKTGEERIREVMHHVKETHA